MSIPRLLKRLRVGAVTLVIGGFLFVGGLSESANAASQAGADALELATQAQASYDKGIELRRTDPGASEEAFRQSAREWQRVIDAGASNGTVHFNLGNAYLQSGDLGRAIASYLRAERSMPGDPDLEQNLSQARSAVQQAFAPGGSTLLVDSVVRWWHIFPMWVRQGGAWLAWGVFWTVLLLQFLAPARVGGTRTRDSVRKLTLACSLAVWCLLGGTLIAEEAVHAMRPRGVVVASDVQLRKGNGDGFDPAYAESLTPGVEFSIREERPGWLRIELPDGRSGWIKGAQAERT